MFLVAVFSLILASVTHQDQPFQLDEPRRKGALELEIHSQPVILKGFCLVFGGRGTADNFFEGLKRTETPSGTVFRKNGNAVKHFPGTLSVTLIATGSSCTEKPSGQRFPKTAAMGSIRFATYWKDGLQLRPVKSCSLDRFWSEEIETATGGTLTAWKYHLTIKDLEVPLSNHLVIVLSNGEGSELARLSGSL